MVKRLFLAVPRGCLRFVIVVFPDHTHLLFIKITRIVFFKKKELETAYLVRNNLLMKRGCLGDYGHFTGHVT